MLGACLMVSSLRFPPPLSALFLLLLKGGCTLTYACSLTPAPPGFGVLRVRRLQCDVCVRPPARLPAALPDDPGSVRGELHVLQRDGAQFECSGKIQRRARWHAAMRFYIAILLSGFRVYDFGFRQC